VISIKGKKEFTSIIPCKENPSSLALGDLVLKARMKGMQNKFIPSLSLAYLDYFSNVKMV